MSRFILALAILIPLATVLFVSLGTTPESKPKTAAEPETSQAVEAAEKFSVDITKDNFEEWVGNSDRPVILDFWAPWCGPCMMLGPHLEKIAQEYEGQITVGKVNVDEQPELALKFKASSLPLVLIIHKGEVIEGFQGYDPEVPGDLRTMIDGLIKP